MVETEPKEALVDIRKDLLSGRRYAPLWLEVFSMGEEHSQCLFLDHPHLASSML